MSDLRNEIHFSHISGSIKNIPGVRDHADLSPRMKLGTRFEPSLNKDIPTFIADPTHVVRVALLEENPNHDVDKSLPPTIQEALEKEHASEYIDRVRANRRTRQQIYDYANRGEVKVVHDGPVSEQEAAKQGAIQLDLSEIARADHIERGIPIPEYIQKVNPGATKAAEAARKEIENPKSDSGQSKTPEK